MENLEKKIIAIMLISILLVISISGCTERKPIKKNNIISILVGDNNEADFTSIQDAVNNISIGGTIFVKNGVYNEILVLNKSISLIGENTENTIISCIINKDSFSNKIIFVNADNCIIQGFNISCKYYSSGVAGIYINSSNNTISNNYINNYDQGIYLDTNTRNNTIKENRITNSKEGIEAYASDSNIIKENNISDTKFYGIYLHGANENEVSKNYISDNNFGIRITSSNKNYIFENTIINNSGGLKLCCASKNNVLYKNIFKENFEWNAIDDVLNEWDNGNVGNYWDDYQVKYPDASSSNGIWETPYTVNDDIIDRFPLVNPPDI